VNGGEHLRVAYLKEGRWWQRCIQELSGRGHAVAGADSVGALVEYQHRVDLLLMAIDGAGALQQFARLGCERRARTGAGGAVLILDQGAAASTRIAVLKAGADAVLPASAPVEEIEAHALALKRRCVQGSAAVELRFGPILLDLIFRRAWVDDSPVTLTPLQFQLLAYLIVHHDRVVSVAELKSAVFRAHYDEESAVVRNQINQLRSRLGSAGNVVRTVRCQGYALSATSRPHQSTL
jgi:DNA-binding response OmpR family regulator